MRHHASRLYKFLYIHNIIQHKLMINTKTPTTYNNDYEEDDKEDGNDRRWQR